MLKKIKLLLSIIISVIIIIGIIILCVVIAQYREQKAEANRRDYIQTLINTEMALNNFNNEEDKNEKPEENTDDSNLNLDDIVSGSLNESTINSVFTNITMHNASTFTATLNKEEKTYRLIGINDEGDQESVKSILESLTKIVITYDVMRTRKGETIEQIYLWDTSDTDISNMINLKLVSEGICTTTYLGTGYAEQTNVKYALQFVSASKQ